MAEKKRCEICDRNFKSEDSLARHNFAKHSENLPKEKKPFPIKKIINWSIILIVIALLIGGIIRLISNSNGLPPIDIKGHIESNPQSHVLKKPMRIEVQKHMLEHADGVEGGKGGVIINYNCKDYTCDGNLIEDLEFFTAEYYYVYVAPFKGMDAKIALTRLGKIEVLEEYDKNKIRKFIEGDRK